MSETPATPEAPRANFEASAPARAELAGRGQRLVAAVFDGFLYVIPSAGVAWALGLYDEAMRTGVVPFGDAVASSVLGLVFYLAINGHFIYAGGQTLGKKLLGIVVVNVDDDRPVDGNRYVFLRIVPIWAASLVPLAGPVLSLLDPLFIFGRERRCIHDYIAATRVIRL